MLTYEEKFEYILDNGLECRCCPLRKECDGKVKQTPSGPVLPACAEHGYEAVLIREKVNEVFREVTSND